MTKVIIIGMWHVRINYNTIRIINTLLLFLFFGFLSCENGTRNTIRLKLNYADLPQGVYFVKLTIGIRSATKKVIIK